MQTDESKKYPHAAPDRGYQSTKILLIDSNDEDRERLAHRLRSIPEYAVFEASSGEAGLLLCHLERFDCVVTEVDLPDTSGFQVLLSLVPVPERPQIAVIVLTRTLEPMHRHFSLGNGAHAYLVKSRTSGDVVDTAIREAIAAVQSKRENGPP